MRGSIRLVTIRGIAIRLHWSFLALLVLVFGYYVANGFMAGSPSAGLRRGLLSLLFITLLFSLVVLHELAHSFVAQRFGMTVREIILLPIGGMALMERIPEEPGKEAAIAVAGPAFNAVVAGLLFLFIWWLPGVVFYPFDLELNQTAFTWGTVALFQINLMLFLFNLLPAFPMDGGRLLRAALVKYGLPYARATSRAVTTSRVILALMLVYGVLKLNPFMVLIPLILMGSATAEESAVKTRSALGGLRARHLLPQELSSVGEKTALAETLPPLLSSGQRHFPVMRGRRIVGVVSLADIREALARPGGPEAPVSSAMRPVITVTPDEPLADIRQKLDAKGGRVACIVSRGKLVGMVSPDTLSRLSSLLESGGE